MDVLTLGEALACFAPVIPARAGPVDYSRTFGGAELNTAIGLARLGDSVCWMSRVGSDPLGDELMSLLEEERIDSSSVTRSSTGQTAVMLKERRSPHESEVHYYRAGSAASELTPGELPPAVIRSAGIVHVSGILLSIGDGPRDFALDVLATARRAGIPISFDPNFRPSLISRDSARELFCSMLPDLTYLLCNEAEALLISGRTDPVDAAAALADLGPRCVIVKRGVVGSVARIDGVRYAVPSFAVSHPVDSVGAGDAFNAGWLHSRVHGIDVEAGIRLASFVAARVVEHPGDYAGFPTRLEVDEWLSTGKVEQ